MELRIEYDDMATPYLKQLAEQHPNWIASALKSAAFHAQKAIKEGIRSQAPGGKPYEPHRLNDWSRAKLEYALTGHSRRAYPIMGQLRQAVGYDSSRAASGVVTVGWLSHSAAYIGKKQQTGYTAPFTERMRKAFMAAGLHPSKHKTTVTITPRQTFAPMVPRVQAIALQTMEQRLLSYVQGNQSRSAKTGKRVYRVYQ